MATKVKYTLLHADKFKEFDLFRERTTLVFPLFSNCTALALQRFEKFLTESMGWKQEEARDVIYNIDEPAPYEITKEGVSIVISSVRMDNSLVIHYDVYHYEDR